MTEVINLRGHHLKVLGYGLRELLKQPAKGKDIKWELYEMYSWWRGMAYSREVVENTSRIFSKIIKRNVKVRLICTLDDICEKCNLVKINMCNLPLSSHAKSMERDDIDMIDGYNLKLGKAYTSKYILRRMLSKDAWAILKRYIKTK